MRFAFFGMKREIRIGLEDYLAIAVEEFVDVIFIRSPGDGRIIDLLEDHLFQTLYAREWCGVINFLIKATHLHRPNGLPQEAFSIVFGKWWESGVQRDDLA